MLVEWKNKINLVITRQHQIHQQMSKDWNIKDVVID